MKKFDSNLRHVGGFCWLVEDIAENIVESGVINTLTVTVYISFDIFMLQALAGSCAGHDCTEGNICKGKTSDGRFECIFKCKYFIFYILRFYLFKYVQPLSVSVIPQ